MAIKEVKPYQTQEGSKKDQVTKMFDKIAPKYDFLNRFLSAGTDQKWRRKAISYLKDKRQRRILDVATGTGDLAIEAARQLNCEKIIGLDISHKMLEIGRKKIDKKGLTDLIEMVKGDSENLLYEDNYFDAITAAFGVRNFGNLKKGLQEMRRVLSPGGTVVILEFSRPRVFPLKQGYNLYFKHLLPVIGKITSKDPKAYKYLYESVQNFPDYEAFESVLKEVGFVNTEWKPLTFGICTIYLAQK